MTLEALRLAVNRPSSWLILGVLMSATPLLSALGTIGIHADKRQAARLFYDVAFIAIVLGAASGMAILARISGFTAHASGAPSWVARLAVISSFAALHAVGVAFPVVLLGIPIPAPAALEFAPRLALVLLAVAGLGSLLLGWVRPPHSAPWILATAAFAAPVLQARAFPDPSLGLLAAGLLSAGWLLEHPPGRTT